MLKLASSALAAALAGLGLATPPAQAQVSRTFVSAASGNDLNNCDRPTPCRTFQGAHNKTNPDGEVTVLDAGGYGSLTVTKSISIVNDGVGEASVLVSGGTVGIAVTAGAASYVNLRGITVQGIGFGGGVGVEFNTGFALTMTNCVVRNHTSSGIIFAPTASARLAVSNTLVADNGGSGIRVIPTGNDTALVRVVLSRVEVYNNSINGLSFDAEFGQAALMATVADSMVANNLGDGVQASTSNGGAEPVVTVVHSAIVNNDGIGANALNASFLILGDSTVTRNDMGVSQVWSYGDNRLEFNFRGDGTIAATIQKR